MFQIVLHREGRVVNTSNKRPQGNRDLQTTYPVLY